MLLVLDKSLFFLFIFDPTFLSLSFFIHLRIAILRRKIGDFVKKKWRTLKNVWKINRGKIELNSNLKYLSWKLVTGCCKQLTVAEDEKACLVVTGVFQFR